MDHVNLLERRVCLSAGGGPVVTDAQFLFDAFPTRQTITLKFNENIGESLQEQNVVLQNLTTASRVPRETFGVEFDQDTDVASIRFDGSFPSHVLPDGNYRLTLPAGSVQDAAGNALATDFTFDFFAFGGDANRDRKVDLTDFTVLAANFNKEGRTFSQGDFSYDGKVDLTDFTILAANFNKTLAPPAAAPAAAMRIAPAGALPTLQPVDLSGVRMNADTDPLAELI